MTRVLMSCDDRIIMHNGQYYAVDRVRSDFYQRYLRVFDTLRLVCRCEEEKELQNSRVLLTNDSRIEIIPIPFFHGPKEYAREYIKVGCAMRNAVKGCDAAVLRIPSTVALRVGKIVKKTGIPYVCEVVFDAQDGMQGEHGLSRLLWKKIDKDMRYLCASADGVSCVTENYLQKHYYSKKGDSFTSHYSSLSLPASFYSSNRKFPTHRPFVIAHTANQVQFNGRKGHIELIKAVRLLKDEGREVKVQFAGKDYYGGVNKLKDLAKDLGVANEVEFVGFLSREELDTFLNNADLYVMPTRAEGLPRVIIEAMAKGLPCITTPVSGNPELIDNHFLVPYERIDELAERIEEIITRPEIYEQTSLINFEKSKQYEASLLQLRRDEFYTKLKDRVINQ